MATLLVSSVLGVGWNLASEQALIAEPRAYEQQGIPQPPPSTAPEPAPDGGAAAPDAMAPGAGGSPPPGSGAPSSPPAPVADRAPPPKVSANATAQSGAAARTNLKAQAEAHPNEIASEAFSPAIGPRPDGTNYFVINARDFRKNCASLSPCETGMVQFRIDLAYDITRLEAWPNLGYFYFTLPIRFLSFWDLFDRVDGSQSSPFFETDYSPGLEFSYVPPRQSLVTASEDTRRTQWHMIAVGVLHESNGLGNVVAQSSDLVHFSRSWNRLYLTGRLAIIDLPHLQLSVSPTVWLPWDDDRIDEKGWPNGSLARTRIQDYMGYGEGVAILHLKAGPWMDFRVRTVFRQYSVDAELRWSIKRAQILKKVAVEGNGFRLDVLAHCFFGEGERLIVANESHRSCYVGLGL